MKNAKNYFAQMLMEKVRDYGLLQFERIINGSDKSEYAKPFESWVKGLNENDQDLLRQMVAFQTDLVLSALLDLVEKDPKLQLLIHEKDGSSSDIVSLSDGLVGELFTEAGWIAQFSKFASPFNK